MLDLLKKHFGYDEFRPLQRDIIENVLAKKDALVLMATGGGKSLCFQLPALKFEGVTIVISPLISLMKDQVDALKSNGIWAEFINSTLSWEEISRIKSETLNKRIKILYVAPERFGLSSFRSFLQALNISLFAVDEGHCISEWGHDFRPDYRNLKELRNVFPDVPIIALTATATERVREDIAVQLNLDNPRVFQSSFDRANLNYIVRYKQKAFSELLELLNRHKNESVIIYCFSRKNAAGLAENLRAENFNAMAYHAGLDNKTRHTIQEKFIRDEISIIVATIAFGMGIDKPDIRLIVHYDLPKSLEGYYQETGRAGRDGLPSTCVLFYSYGDKVKHDFFIEQIEDLSEKKKAQKKLRQLIDFCELHSCRRKYILEYFGEKWEKEDCGGCDVCLKPKEEFDATIISQKILSCIIRTGERFGTNHIIDVLLGKNIQRIRDLRHDNLSVFGIVKDFDKEELRQLINCLVARKLVIKNHDGYPTLNLSEVGWKFIRQREKIALLKPEVKHGFTKKKNASDMKFNADLFGELRILRKGLADARGVPPFVVFGDRSLREMATFYPQSLDSFSRISGVGAQKLSTYGMIFIETIRNYAIKHGLEDISPTGVSREKKRLPEQTGLLKQPGSTYNETKKICAQKFSVVEIAKRRGITEGTVISHLEKIAASGDAIRIEHLKPSPERFKKIESAFQLSEGLALKPVKDILGEEFSYNELKLARLFLTRA